MLPRRHVSSEASLSFAVVDVVVKHCDAGSATVLAVVVAIMGCCKWCCSCCCCLLIVMSEGSFSEALISDLLPVGEFVVVGVVVVVVVVVAAVVVGVGVCALRPLLFWFWLLRSL